MKATTLSEVVLVTRAAAAYATAIKATSDAIRSTLPIDRLTRDAPEDLPELVVRVMTPKDIKRLKKDLAARTLD
jgi:hypothetical protein